MVRGESMRDRMLAGELYIADDPELGQESTRVVRNLPAGVVAVGSPARVVREL
jgi:serine acetyltransferase